MWCDETFRRGPLGVASSVAMETKTSASGLIGTVKESFRYWRFIGGEWPKMSGRKEFIE